MNIDLTVGKDTAYSCITENLFAVLNGAWHKFLKTHFHLNVYPGIVYYIISSWNLFLLSQELNIQVEWWNDAEIFFNQNFLTEPISMTYNVFFLNLAYLKAIR